MRIVGGRHRGRPLTAPPGADTRPTSDRAREALFNMLAHSGEVELEGAVVLDAFAGSGALGLEALSRGAAQVFLLDNGAAAIQAIRANIAALGEAARTTVLRADATRPPRAKRACELVLLDPPYGSGLGGPALTALDRMGWLAAEALCVVEVAAKEELVAPPGFAPVRERIYGAARLVFVRKA